MTSCRIGIKAVPGASKDQLAGWLGDDLKVRVQAPPENGRANAALCQFLATALGLPKGSVTVVTGHSARRKLVEISGLDETEARRGLERALTDAGEILESRHDQSRRHRAAVESAPERQGNRKKT